MSAVRRRPPSEEATAPRSTRRERKPPRTSHCAEKTSRCRGRVAAERHAAASADARACRRQERWCGAAGSGAVSAVGSGTVSAVRRRPTPERKRPRLRPHAESKSFRALRTAPKKRAAATESGGRASRRRERGGKTKPAPGTPARRRRQWRRERRPTATAARGEATAPTSTSRECEPLSATHRAERASRHRRRAAPERYAAARAATRLSRRQEH